MAAGAEWVLTTLGAVMPFSPVGNGSAGLTLHLADALDPAQALHDALQMVQIGNVQGQNDLPLLALEGVSTAFAGVQAVRRVSLEIPTGAVVGIMGPNGSGKTTLFNLIAGAMHPDQGRIRFRGQDVTRLPSHRRCAGGVARTFQHVRPFHSLTAIDNVLVGILPGRR